MSGDNRKLKEFTPDRPAFRFAPSPTGYLHIGHALSAIIGHQLARRYNGRFLVRIEDTDTGRARQNFVDAILEDLAWLGLDWEEPVVLQSRRLDLYRAHQDNLVATGLLYPCFATRKEIAAASCKEGPFDPDGAPIYPGLYKSLDASAAQARIASGEAYALRLDMDRAIATARDKLSGSRDRLGYVAFAPDGAEHYVDIEPSRWGDVVIVRKDTGTSYHLAGVIDDAQQGVTHVARGKDLEAATDIHRLLQVLLDLPAPIYHHHDLVLDEHGRKLSKSAGDTSLRVLREQGWSGAGVRRKLEGFLHDYID